MYRVCDICGGVDDHPRHSFAGVIPDIWIPDANVRDTVVKNAEAALEAGTIDFAEASGIVASFDDTTSTDRHIDCCALNGCPLAGTLDGCDIRAERADGGTGQEMVDAVMAIRQENIEHFEPKEG
jgi:hypothetical protein